MIKISKVKIEGFHKVGSAEYDLKQVNYFHGRNGAGKSTILQAIQLGLLGYIPGTDKKVSAIYGHSNGRIMTITLTLDDNGNIIEIMREWLKTSAGKIDSVCKITPASYDLKTIVSEVELPIFNFTDFLNLSANKLKDWFVNFLPSEALNIDWTYELTNAISGVDVTDMIEPAEDYISGMVDIITDSDLEGVELVRSANNIFKSNVSMIKQEFQRIENTIQSLIYYEDFEEEYSEEECLSKINALHELKGKIASRDSIRSRNTIYVSQLESYKDFTNKNDDAEIQTWNSKVTESTESYNKLDVEYKESSEKLAELKAELNMKNKLADSDGICPYTSVKCNSIANIIEDAKAERDSLADMIAELTSRLSNIQTSKFEISKQIRELSDMVSAKCDKYTKFENLKASIVPEPEINETKSVPEIDDEIAMLQEYLSKKKANDQYNSMINTLISQKTDAEIRLNINKIWDKLTGVNGLQTSSNGDNPFTKFAENLNTYVPTMFGEDVKASFIVEAKANSFDFGITRNNTYIPYNLLSSGEKCLFSIAMMISIVAISDNIKCVIVDDLIDHLDAKHIESLYNVVEKIEDVQFIFAGVQNIPESFNNYTIELED